jgi:hypothetical protein
MIEKRQMVCVCYSYAPELPKRIATVNQLIRSAIETTLKSLTLEYPTHV